MRLHNPYTFPATTPVAVRRMYKDFQSGHWVSRTLKGVNHGKFSPKFPLSQTSKNVNIEVPEGRLERVKRLIREQKKVTGYPTPIEHRRFRSTLKKEWVQ